MTAGPWCDGQSTCPRTGPQGREAGGSAAAVALGVSVPFFCRCDGLLLCLSSPSFVLAVPVTSSQRAPHCRGTE